MVVLARSHDAIGLVGGGGMAVIGGGWIYGVVQFFHCDEVPEPCGAPGWLDVAVEACVAAGVLALVGAALVSLVRRARRSRSAP